MLFDLENAVVVITGGLGQLGRQFARGLLEHNARVVLLDLPPVVESAGPLPGGAASADRIMPLAADITSRPSLETALDAIRSRWGEPAGLVNGAALDSPPDAPAEENGPFEDYPRPSWDRVLEVNLTGMFLSCQVFGGAMAAAGHGSIVNISSIYGVVSPRQDIYEYRRRGGETFFKPVAYSATKSGVLNLTRYLATYWARRGVRVNTLTLAGMFNHQDSEFLEAYEPNMPLGRMARENEYNGGVVFLCSDASSYVTGANLVMDGGWTAW